MTYPFLRIALVAAALAVPSLAHADDEAASLPPSYPPPSVQAPVVAGEHTCFVGEHFGLDEADARTTTDLVCDELGQQKAPAGAYDVRFGKLGRRVLLSVTVRATGVSRRVLLQSLDEIPVAANRLVAALAMQTSVERTQNVDNIVEADSRKVRAKSVAAIGELSLVGMTAVGVDPSTSAGMAAGIMFRSARWSMGGHLRGGEVGSASNRLGFASLDVGARYHFGEADTAIFLGGGLSLSYLKVDRDPIKGPPGNAGYSYWNAPVDLSPSGSGFGAYVEGGVSLLRSSRAGFVFSVRADAPFYVLEAEGTLGSGSSAEPAKVARYVLPVSFNVGFAFH